MKFLPLVNTVYAVCTHIVAATNPRVGIIPLPGFFLSPLFHKKLLKKLIF